jgi:TolB-like protein
MRASPGRGRSVPAQAGHTAAASAKRGRDKPDGASPLPHGPTAAHGDSLPTADEIRTALRALLDDPRFVASARNRRFLAYVVEEELQGRGQHIKAYRVAVEAFRRPRDFDPDLDPIVRIEAGRLRRGLEQYYEEHTDAAAWRFSIPKGAYRPRFERTGPAAPDHAAMPEAAGDDGRLGPAAPAGARTGVQAEWKRRPFLLAMLFGATLAATFLAALGYHGLEKPPQRAPAGTAGPAILVPPFAALDGDAGTARLALGLTRDVVDRLLRFRSFDVYGPALYEDALGRGGVDFARLAERVRAGYVVEGTLRRAADRIVVIVQLKERTTGRYLWTYRAENALAAEEVFASLFDVASQIATTLGQPYGVVNRAEWLQRQPHSIGAYQCVLQAHDYYRSIDARGHAGARDCLERAVATDPTYAAAWVMLAWVYLDEARYRLNPRPALYDAETKAREAVDRALTLDSEQGMALDALSVLQFRAGDMAGFRATGAKMIALNPNDPDLAADYGSRLAFSGNWEAGMPLVRRALELALEPPGTYHMVLAWDHYRQRDYQAALREAEKIRMPEFQLAVLTRAAIYGQLGMRREASAALADLRRLRPDLAEDPRPWLLSLHFERAFADSLAEGVGKAGRLDARR